MAAAAAGSRRRGDRSGRIRTVLTAVAGVLFVLPTTASARAAVRVEVAWWTSAEAGGAVVQEGGSQVATTSDGPVSMAALRLVVPAGATVDYTVAIDTWTPYADVYACPATSAWVPTSGGQLADAPTWDCDLADASGRQDGAASSITWHLGPAFTKSGVVDVALVPGVLHQSWLRPESQSRRAWSLTMAPPAEDSVQITPAPGASTAPTTTVAATVATSPAAAPVPGSTQLVPPPGATVTQPTTAPEGTTEVAAPVSDRRATSAAGRGNAGLALAAAAVAVAVARGVGRSRRGETHAPSDI